MYSHVQLNENGEFLRLITAGAAIEWDANNYCTAFALETDDKAGQFRVLPYYTAGEPAYDPVTQTLLELDPAPVDGRWTQQWAVTDLTPDQIEEIRKSKVPVAVTMRQARLALLGAGLLDDVEAAISSLPSPQKEAARIEWEYAAEVQRHNGLALVLGAALGLDDAGLDALFVAGEKL